MDVLMAIDLISLISVVEKLSKNWKILNNKKHCYGSWNQRISYLSQCQFGSLKTLADLQHPICETFILHLCLHTIFFDFEQVFSRAFRHVLPKNFIMSNY